MTMSTGFHGFMPSFLHALRPRPSPQPELDRDFDQHVDRRAEPPRGREPPLTHRVHCALVEPGAQALHDADRPDTTVAPDDDLEHHITREAAPPRILGVVGLDLLQDGRGGDAAARTVRTAAGSAAAAIADARSRAFADARSAAVPRPRRSPIPGWPTPVRLGAGSLPVPSDPPGRSRRAPRPAGSDRASRPAAAARLAARQGAASGHWPRWPRRIGDGPPHGAFDRHRALQRARALEHRRPRRSRLTQSAAAPSAARPWLDEKHQSSGRRALRLDSAWLVTSEAPSASTAPKAACRRPEAVSGMPRRSGRLPQRSEKLMPGAGPVLRPRSSSTARTASSVDVSPPSRDAIRPDASSASASANETPAARAISRAVKTSGTTRVRLTMAVPANMGQKTCRRRLRERSRSLWFFGVSARRPVGLRRPCVLVLGQRWRTSCCWARQPEVRPESQATLC